MSLTNYLLINLQLQNTNLKSILMEKKKNSDFIDLMLLWVYFHIAFALGKEIYFKSPL